MVRKIITSDAVQWCFDGGTPGLAVTVATGDGDGTYPVRVRRTASGEVAALLIEFLPEDGSE